MTRPLPAFLAFAMAAVASQPPQPENSIWVGLWQTLLDGQPSVTLTLAQDTGELDGTVVFDIISREGGRSRTVAHEPHVLVHPRCDEKMLSFQLKRIDGSSDPMNFTVRLTSSSTAKIHCENCGPDAPIVQIVKLP